MPKISNITRRSGSPNWYFRRAYPADVAEIVGKGEHWESLKTADLTEARKRAARANLVFEGRLDTLRRQQHPSPDDIDEAVREFYQRETAIEDRLRFGDASRGDDDSHVEYRKDLRPGFEATLREHIAKNVPVLVEWAIEEIIEKNSWLIERDSKEYRDLTHKLLRAQLEGVEREKEKDRGDFDGKPQAPFLNDRRTASPRAKSGETIMELFERYGKEQRGQASSTLNQSRKTVRRFAEFVGLNSHISAVSKANARDWKYALELWPTTASESREFSGLDFNQIIKANETLNKSVIGVKTIRKYLSALGSFSRWLMRNGYIEAHATEGLMPEFDRRERKRAPLPLPSLNTIFASPLYTGHAGRGQEHVSGSCCDRGGMYWLFPLALYTGCRLGEICQLVRGDVQEREGVAFIDINAEGDKRVKARASVRSVPLHPVLVKTGFVDWVKSRLLKPADRLFPEWERDANGFHGEYLLT